MHSMTGFGRGSAATDTWHATVEASSINRKQAEVVVQAPRELSGLEGRVRKAVLGVASRGRIQISIHLETAEGSDSAIRINAGLAKAFHNAFTELGNVVGHPVEPTAADYLRQPGILNVGALEIDPEDAWKAIEPALADALGSLSSMRETEGRHLKEDFLLRLETLAACRDRIAQDAPSRPVRQREMLLKRLRDAGLDLDPADERVVKELALYADRCDVTEEITRLDSHFSKFREYLDAAEPPGRALDFLSQEFHREINTIGSKANDARIAAEVVLMKTELERFREQVQNVE